MREIQHVLLEWYARNGRSHLPWRTTRDPYRVLVSEFMLQQTQVDRVLPKFTAFVERFPDFRDLAETGAAEVVRYWQGLGYNARSVRLHAIARTVTERFAGRLPRDAAELRALPGVGPYTAAALRAFAFDLDDAAIDTNVRRVAHRWLHGVEYPPKVSRARLDAETRELVPHGRGHDWNSALMDLGATICTARAPSCPNCPVQSLCAAAPLDAAALARARRRHAPQASPQAALAFRQTTRFARGRIVDRLRALAPGEQISLLDLHRELEPVLADRSIVEVGNLVQALERDGLLEVRGGLLALRE